MSWQPTKFSGLWVFESKLFKDDRGAFSELWTERRMPDNCTYRWVQNNLSTSRKDVLRGLHAQFPSPQAKLISVLQGAVFDVAVDLRKNSPTFGQYLGMHVSAQNRLQLLIPPGFAHGFLSLSDETIFHYKCSDFYNPETEYTIKWDDPDLNIAWPKTSDILISPKDEAGMRLKDLSENRLTPFSEKT